MTKKEFIALGLSEEQAEACEKASKAELSTYIPKTRFDEVNEAKKKAEKTVEERDTQLEELKKTAGNTEELNSKIAELQKQNKENADKYAADIKDMQLSNAIKLALSDKTHDADMVSALFDKAKLILSDDGKVTGLDEQLASIKESKPFLFKEEPKPNANGAINNGFRIGTQAPANAPQNQSASGLSLRDAIANAIQSHNTI